MSHHGSYKIHKPKFFFRAEEEGEERLPDTWQLVLTPPLGVDSAEVNELIDKAVLEHEAFFRENADKEGKKFLGRAAILRQSIYGTPKCPATHGKMSPRVACKDRWRRAEVLKGYASFEVVEVEHKEARLSFEGGDQEVTFPLGTYWHAKRYGVKQEGVRCAQC